MENPLAVFVAYTQDELNILSQSSVNNGVLFELKNNFFRKFKHQEATADEVLEALEKELEEINPI
jgi:hypothetical protein